MKRYIVCIALLNSISLLATEDLIQEQEIELEQQGELDEFDTLCTFSSPFSCLLTSLKIPYYCCMICVIYTCEKDSMGLYD